MKTKFKRILSVLLVLVSLITFSFDNTSFSINTYAEGNGGAGGGAGQEWYYPTPSGPGASIGLNIFPAYRLIFVYKKGGYSSNDHYEADYYHFGEGEVDGKKPIKYVDNITPCYGYLDLDPDTNGKAHAAKSYFFFPTNYKGHARHQVYWSGAGASFKVEMNYLDEVAEMLYMKDTDKECHGRGKDNILENVNNLTEWINNVGTPEDLDNGNDSRERRLLELFNGPNFGWNVQSLDEVYIVYERACVYKNDEGALHRDFCVTPQSAYWTTILQPPFEAPFGNNKNSAGKFNLHSHIAEASTSHIKRLFEENSISAYMTKNYFKASTWIPKTIEGTSETANWNSEGYCIFFFDEGLDSSSSAANVVVEYKGDPNTQDQSKFVADTSFVYETDDGTAKYWDISSESWKDMPDEVNQECLNIRNVEVNDDDYAVAFADTYNITLNNSLPLTEFIKKGNACTTGYNLKWGITSVTGHDKDVGVTIGVNSINNDASTQAIADKLQSNLGSATIKNKVELPEDDFYPSDIIDTCFNTFVTAYETRGNSSGQDKNVLTSSNQIKPNVNFGLGIEFIARGKPVTSTKYTIHATMMDDTPVNVTGSQTWSENYSTASSTECDIGNVVGYVVIPNSFAPDLNSAISTVNSILSGGSSDIETRFTEAFSNTKLAGSDSNFELGVGCTEDTAEGFTIYELEVDYQTSALPVDTQGKLELPSYMLNRYFDNVIQTSSSNVGNKIKYTLRKDWTRDRSKDKYKSCKLTGHEYLTYFYRDYRIQYTDVSSGTEFGFDSGSLLQYYYPKATGTWDHSKRSDLAGKWFEYNTEGVSNNSIVIDYAFNLVRSAQGDLRSVSGISYPNYVSATSDSLDILRIKSQFGVVPKTVKTVTSPRNPSAIVSSFTETVKMNNKYTIGNSITGEQNVGKSKHKKHTWYTGKSPHRKKRSCGSFTYYPNWVSHTCQGFAKNGSPVSSINYQFTNNIYKYLTQQIDTGINTKIGSASMIPISVRANKPAEGKVSATNEYRFSTAHYNNLELMFYPEVLMAYKTGGTSFDLNPYQSVRTIGEVKRIAESSSLYLYKINSVGTGDITGTTYSDSAQGGTAIKGNSHVTIPAGSDVYVAADPSGFTVDLYGYALDVVDKNYDSSMKTSASTSVPYNSVVSNGENVHSKWGNSDYYTVLKSNFETWCNNMLDVQNYAADFELYVDNSDKSENFSAVVGSVRRPSTSANADGVYYLVFENGKLVEGSGEYSSMIEQIAADYDCSTSEAKQVFESSGLYTAILEAIESSTDSFNHSGKAVPGVSIENGGSDWTSVLGNSDNWYDEKVGTIVVRRFTNTGNQLQSITATDKIDFGLAPNSRGSNKQNSNGGVVKDAKWCINIFFNPDNSSIVDDNLLKNGTYYNPADGTGNAINTPNSAYSVLVNKAPVVNADFLISAVNTSDFR